MNYQYYVTYDRTSETTLEHEPNLYFEDTDSSLESVIENCVEHKLEADLFDEAGWRKGWVHSDGSYKLQ